MQKQLETGFDNWDWTIIPEGPDVFRVSFFTVGLCSVVSCTKTV